VNTNPAARLVARLVARLAGGESVVRGSAAFTVSRVVSILAALVVVGIVARRLSPDDFGFWSALASLTTLSTGLDLGIGNAARNRMTALRAGGDEDAAAEVYAATLLTVGTISGVLVLAAEVAVVVIAGGLGRWDPGQREAAMIAVAMLGGLQVANVGAMALLAREQPTVVAVVDTTRWLVILAAVAVAAVVNGSLVAVTGAYFAALAGSAALSLILVARDRHWRRRPPGPGRTWTIARGQMAAASGFAALQVSATLFYQTDVILAAQLAPLAGAGQFALVMRLFAVPFSLQSGALTPLWSSTAAALARGDRRWVRRTTDHAALLSVGLLAAAAVGGVLIGPWFIRVWAGKEIDNMGLYAGFGAWLVVAGWVAVHSVVLNGAGRLRLQVVLLIVAIVLKLAIAVTASRVFGLSALPWAAAVALLPLAWSNRREVVRATAER